MEIQLSPEVEQIVKDKVASGMYPDANEFVREAILRTVEWDYLKRKRLNEAIAIGIEQAKRGELVDLDMDQINAELDAEEGHFDS
ncbi:type II toxin-antitoxin system ParD family antitoxin [candidate division KSB1 bacterium]|nr:type II toxin-antitoxin system ParD family antitoxin [candidate division KSB1 bacterium]